MPELNKFYIFNDRTNFDLNLFVEIVHNRRQFDPQRNDNICSRKIAIFLCKFANPNSHKADVVLFVVYAYSWWSDVLWCLVDPFDPFE
jgi:hypothetical protein